VPKQQQHKKSINSPNNKKKSTVIFVRIKNGLLQADFCVIGCYRNGGLLCGSTG
jgi:hypothetical protein